MAWRLTCCELIAVSDWWLQLKCMVLPVAGAVLGGAVGGPVGIFAGLKAAKLAAFSGGILGIFFTSSLFDYTALSTVALRC